MERMNPAHSKARAETSGSPSRLELTNSSDHHLFYKVKASPVRLFIIST